MHEPEFPADLVFAHLSDIHFRKGRVGDLHDVDADLRNELERDLRTFRATRMQKVDGIIVSGDIAFGGAKEEFTYASAWIEKIRELIDCPKRGIMVTPGNHDVDRDSVTPDGDVDKLHTTIRAADGLAARDDALAIILRDRTTGPRLFASIKAYNIFAAEYDCMVTPGCPFWERDFALGNKATLKIRGMTSTLISGPRDHEQTHKVVYGGAQRQLMRGDRVIRAVVGHHPPSWTLEGDDADKAFKDRAAIQLFGHKHENWYNKFDTGIRVIAGAIHPERGKNWDPRYSIVAVKLQEDGRLLTRIYPRRWSREESTFIGDFNSQGQDFRDHAVENAINTATLQI